MKKLLPIILLIAGSGIGAGAGIVLKPESKTPCEETSCDEVGHGSNEGDGSDVGASDEAADYAFVAMKSQFVVPIVRQERVAALVVLSLSLQVPAGEEEAIYSREPKLRDVFLKVLFDHANIGGFDGAFTQSGKLSLLRVALLEAARHEAKVSVSDVLITDIVRQEM